MNINGDNNANTLIGTNAADTISGNGGNDFINGRGGNDTILGGSGNDFIRGDAGADQIFGGADDDIIVYDEDDVSGSGLVNGGSGQDTVLSAGAAEVQVDNSGTMSDIEVIDLNDFAVNQVVDPSGDIDPIDVEAVTDARNTLRIEGEVGDSIDLDLFSFTFGGFVGGYMVYQGFQGPNLITIEVDPEVEVV